MFCKYVVSSGTLLAGTSSRLGESNYFSYCRLLLAELRTTLVDSLTVAVSYNAVEPLASIRML